MNAENRPAIDVAIRKATISDIPAITEIYNEAILTTFATFDLEPKSIEERTKWFAAHDERFPVLVAVQDGRVVGWSSLTRWSDKRAYDVTAETSVYVHSKHRGHGVGRKLKTAIIDEARRLGFHSLLARVTETSLESIHLNEDAGFVHVGTLKEVGQKFGRLLNVHMMQKILD
jgi:phosphinothricin acetyltransferase